ncbi:MAG: hypothetical protein ACRCTR_03390 [Actinomycetota bacterium]
MRKIIAGAVSGFFVATGAVVSIAPAASATTSPKPCEVKAKPQLENKKAVLSLIDGKCQEVTVNVSSYSLPKTYDGSGDFNASAAPQTLIANRTVTLNQATRELKVPVTLPECGWYQWDVYGGEVLTEVFYPEGHSKFIQGNIEKIKGYSCSTPTSTETSPTTTASPTSTGTPTVTETSPTSTSTPTVSGTESSTTTSVSVTVSGTSASTSTSTPTVSGVVETQAPAGPTLPRTGGGSTPYLVTGLMLLAVGAGLAWFARASRRIRLSRQH